MSSFFAMANFYFEVLRHYYFFCTFRSSYDKISSNQIPFFPACGTQGQKTFEFELVK